MKLLLTFLALLGISTTLPAQYTVFGTVTDALTGEGLSFATVRSLPEENGVYTDGNGGFVLALAQKADSLAVDMIGYESTVLDLNDNRPLVITLSPKTYMTEEVVVEARKGKAQTKRYGNTKHSLVTNGYSRREGTKIIRYLGGDWERNGTLQSVIYRLDGRVRDCPVYARVRIYAAQQVGVSGGPGEELLHKSIIFPLKNSKQRYEIDLSGENINYPPEGLCVGVEFLGNDRGCGSNEFNKDRFYVLLSTNEEENMSFESLGVGKEGWRRVGIHWLSERSKVINAKFGATVSY